MYEDVYENKYIHSQFIPRDESVCGVWNAANETRDAVLDAKERDCDICSDWRDWLRDESW